MAETEEKVVRGTPMTEMSVSYHMPSYDLCRQVLSECDLLTIADV